jgi:hypothetical protein
MTFASDRSARAYELEADETRVRLSNSLDELAMNLTPGRMLDEVLTYTRAGGGDFLRGLGSAASSNPVPTLLISIGAAMFLTGKGRIGSSASLPQSDGAGVLRHAAEAIRTRRGAIVAGPRARQAVMDLPEKVVVPDRARRSAAGVGDIAAGAGRTAASVVSGAAGAVGSAASSTADAVGTAASSAAGAVGSAASGVAERVRSGASAVGAAATDAARTVRATATAGVAAAGDVAAGAGGFVSDAAGTVAGGARAAAETVGQFAGSAREAVTDQGGRIFDQTSRLTRDLMERMGRLIQEQPLAVAAAGLAIGVAVAAALPRTKTEDSLLGETSDAVKDTVAEAASEQFQRAKEATSRVVEGASNAATKEGLSASAAVDAVRDLGDKVLHVVTASADAMARDKESEQSPYPSTPSRSSA